jgi:ADP-heptose:LPS heptosyltransferase
LVNLLAAEGLSLCLIGLDEETRGVWDLDCPEGVIDSRNKLSLGGLIGLISQARMLISNDSGPIHLAGAFDNWIVLFPTCKHPEHLLPWRHGSQEWKTLALRKRDMIDDLLTDPTEIEPDSAINGEFIPPGKTWGDYLPSPDEVFASILGIVPLKT